jgi:hypothetical protein
MGKRGRKSGAALAIKTVSTVETVERPDAPYDLTDEQTDEWRAIVADYPADKFPRGTHPELTQMCRLVIRARRAAQLLNAMETSELELKEYRDLLRTEKELSLAIVSVSRSLRISNHSNTRHEQSKQVRKIDKPWQN